PPYSVCGWPKTTAARTEGGAAAIRGSPSIVPGVAGSSSSASSLPAGPATSSRGIAGPFDELANQRGELIRTRHRSEVPGRRQHDARRVRNEPHVLGRAFDRHDVVEVCLAGENQRRRGNARAIGRDRVGGDEPGPGGHLPER